MTRTFKAAFAQSGHKDEFAKWAGTITFDLAIEYALLGMAQEMPDEMDPNSAWTNYAKLMGAKRVLQILRELHLPEETPKLS